MRVLSRGYQGIALGYDLGSMILYQAEVPNPAAKDVRLAAAPGSRPPLACRGRHPLTFPHPEPHPTPCPNTASHNGFSLAMTFMASRLMFTTKSDIRSTSKLVLEN